MTIIRMCENATHISEFSAASWGETRNGTCTQASAAMCLTVANGLSTQYQNVVDLMISMRDEMFARGACAENGGATLSNIAQELRNRGANIATEWDYQGDQLPEDWHQLLEDNAGIRPILLQLANAQALTNAAGMAEDAGVRYHAIAVLGLSDEGYVVGDPNNPTVASEMDIYPIEAIRNASPCGLIMLNVVAQPQSQGTGTLPGGWTDDGTNTLTAPNGTTIHDGFRVWCLAHTDKLAAWGNPVIAPHATDNVSDDNQHGPGAECIFERGGLGWTDKENVFELWLGTMVQHTRDNLAIANKQIADLQAELTQLKNQPPAPDDKARAAIVAMKAAIADVG
jgi:hypothetical protein